MKNFILALFILTIQGRTYGIQPKSFSLDDNRLNVAFNTNVELLGFAYFLVFETENIESEIIDFGGNKVLKKDWHNYGFQFYTRYKSFSSSENLARSLQVADHLWLDYIINLLIQLESFPSAKLNPEIEEIYYRNFSTTQNLEEAKQKASIFLDGMNKFYLEVNFGQYLSDSKKYYDAALDQIQGNLPDPDFINEMEKFYHKKFDEYALIPSLTIPKGMGFGMKHTYDNKTKVYNVFGALDFQYFDQNENLDMGFGNSDKIRELSVHEFGHSFVNPVIDKIPEEAIKASESLFGPIKTEMEDQGYTDWKTCLIEHFVRAGEVIISKKLGKKEDAENLQSNYIENRKFLFLPIIISELDSYDKGNHKDYYDAVLKAVKELATVE